MPYFCLNCSYLFIENTKSINSIAAFVVVSSILNLTSRDWSFKRNLGLVSPYVSLIGIFGRPFLTMIDEKIFIVTYNL